MKDRVTSIALKLCAGRTTLNGDEFIALLHELIEASAYTTVGSKIVSAIIPLEELPPQVHPMRTPEQAMEVFRKNHPDMFHEDGTRKPITTAWIPRTGLSKETISPQPLGRERDYVKGGLKINDEGKDSIRRRYRQAKLTGNGRVERGWAKQVAREYDVSTSLIYNIVYSDPLYVAVPRE